MQHFLKRQQVALPILHMHSRLYLSQPLALIDNIHLLASVRASSRTTSKVATSRHCERVRADRSELGVSFVQYIVVGSLPLRGLRYAIRLGCWVGVIGKKLGLLRSLIRGQFMPLQRRTVL